MNSFNIVAETSPVSIFGLGILVVTLLAVLIYFGKALFNNGIRKVVAVVAALFCCAFALTTTQEMQKTDSTFGLSAPASPGEAGNTLIKSELNLNSISPVYEINGSQMTEYARHGMYVNRLEEPVVVRNAEDARALFEAVTGLKAKSVTPKATNNTAGR